VLKHANACFRDALQALKKCFVIQIVNIPNTELITPGVILPLKYDNHPGGDGCEYSNALSVFIDARPPNSCKGQHYSTK
jgi:hypothetical protein